MWKTYFLSVELFECHKFAIEICMKRTNVDEIQKRAYYSKAPFETFICTKYIRTYIASCAYRIFICIRSKPSSKFECTIIQYFKVAIHSRAQCEWTLKFILNAKIIFRRKAIGDEFSIEIECEKENKIPDLITKIAHNYLSKWCHRSKCVSVNVIDVSVIWPHWVCSKPFFSMQLVCVCDKIRDSWPKFYIGMSITSKVKE